MNRNHNFSRRKFEFEGLEQRALFSAVSLPLIPALPLPVETQERWDPVNMPARPAPEWGEVNEWLVLFEELPIDPFELPPGQTYEPPMHDRQAEFEQLSLSVEYVRQLGHQDFVIIRASGTVSKEDLEKAISDRIGGLKSVGFIGAVTSKQVTRTGATAVPPSPFAPMQSFSKVVGTLSGEASDEDDMIRLVDDLGPDLLD